MFREIYPTALAAVALVVAMILCSQETSAQQFEVIDANLPNVKGGSVEWGDFDADGDLDLVVAGSDKIGGANQTTILRNDAGTFVDIDAGLAGLQNPLTQWGDLDGDGDLDLLLSGSAGVIAGDQVHLYRNEDGAFTQVELPFQKGLNAMFADFDGNGSLDVLASGENRFAPVSVALNLGNSFERIEVVTRTGVMQSAVYMEDADGDGDGDILGRFKMWLQEDGTFVQSNFPVGGWQRGVGDANSDGTFDAFGLPNTSNGLMEISLNRGGTFTNVLVGEDNAGSFTDGSRFGDLDNDGDLDIASYLNNAYDPVTMTGFPKRFAVVMQTRHDFEGNTEILEYQPTVDEFPLRQWVGPGGPPDAQLQNALGDFDNDGDLDIVAIGPDSDENALTFLAKNNQTNPNSAPSAPAELKATQVDEGVYRLEWQESSDDTTPTDGLTYAVRVGTTPGGADIMPPLALPNGYRQVMRRGNAGSNEFYILNSLESGTTYYWSLQAIDNSYVGSPFAEEQSFAVMPVAVEDDEVPSERVPRLEVYPNPAVGAISIAYDHPTSGEVEIAIHDVLGREVLHTRLNDSGPGRQTQQLVINHLPPGSYFLTLSDSRLVRSTVMMIR
jgi:hypothetical protein